jgi:tetratricopeptide (TPR) repeat protein
MFANRQLGNLQFDRCNYTEAIGHFERVLLHAPDYAPAIIGLAKTLLSLPYDACSHERAEVLLDSVTKLRGWDSSEAWFWLGEVYERCSLLSKAVECWVYCNELEDRKPLRDWECVKPAWI